jgi:hypothetical protein
MYAFLAMWVAVNAVRNIVKQGIFNNAVTSDPTFAFKHCCQIMLPPYQYATASVV